MERGPCSLGVTRSQRTEPERRRNRSIPVVLGVLAFLVLAWRFDYVCDDAFISFRYARNLVEGHGLRYNPGEVPPVEGYSNLLWVLAMAASLSVGADPVVVSRLLSAACGVLLLLVLARYARERLKLDRHSSGLSLVFLATSPGFALWATSGLETMPFALAVFLAFERLDAPPGPRPWSAGIAAACAALLRADGVLWAGLVLLLAGLSGGAAPGRERRRAVLRAGAVLGTTVALHLLWRWNYYGDWLPNTARVKAGFSWMRIERGLLYLTTYGLTVPGAFLIALVAPFLAGERERPLVRRCLAVVVATAIYVIHIGGDFMPMGRLLTVALPFLTLILAAALAHARRGGRLTPRGFALGALAVALSLPAAFDLPLSPRAWREACHFRWTSDDYRSEVEMWREEKRVARAWSETGRLLARFTRPGESIVLAAIGAKGYYSRLKIYDLYGLVSPEVARTVPPRRASPGHDRMVTHDFFLERRPTYMGVAICPSSKPVGLGAALERFVRIERHPLGEASRPTAASRSTLAAERAAAWELRLFRLRPDAPIPTAAPVAAGEGSGGG